MPFQDFDLLRGFQTVALFVLKKCSELAPLARRWQVGKLAGLDKKQECKFNKTKNACRVCAIPSFAESAKEGAPSSFSPTHSTKRCHFLPLFRVFPAIPAQEDQIRPPARNKIGKTLREPQLSAR
jgi:hypothetical protein